MSIYQGKLAGWAFKGSGTTPITGSTWQYDATNKMFALSNTLPSALLTGGNWKVFYTNGSGVVTELVLGAANTLLTSAGATSAPTFTSTITSPTLSGTVAGTPTWASNQAITLSTAAQGNVTSLGTLTAVNTSGNMVMSGAGDHSVDVSNAASTLVLINRRTAANAGTGFQLQTYSNVDALVNRVQISSGVATATMSIDSTQLAVTGTGSSYGVVLGGDAQWFRGAANRMDLASGDTLRLTSIGARVAGDVYLIVDANGDIHKSAIGPAS